MAVVAVQLVESVPEVSQHDLDDLNNILKKFSTHKKCPTPGALVVTKLGIASTEPEKSCKDVCREKDLVSMKGEEQVLIVPV